MVLQCSKCKKEKIPTEFYPRKNRRRGYTSRCKSCIALKKESEDFRNKAAHRARIWRAKNPKKVSEQNKRQYVKNSEEYKAYQRRYRAANVEYLKKYHAAYNKSHSAERAAKAAKRRATKLQATPSWLTSSQLEEIRIIYRSRAKGSQVDHIVPLVSPIVCGLHVPWNLQLLTASQNASKGNKLLLEQDE